MRIVRAAVLLLALLTASLLCAAETAPNLFQAAFTGQTDVIAAAVKANPDVVKSVDDKYGATLLHSALAKGHVDIAELLLAAGADINAMEKRGYTPLHWAVVGGSKAAVEWLIGKGANLLLAGKDGKTALALANEKQLTEIATLLRNAALDPEPKYDDTQPALASVMLSDETHQQGYITREGKLAFTVKYIKADYFSEGLASVALFGKPAGTTLVNGKAQQIFGIGTEGYIDKTGTMVITTDHHEHQLFAEGLAGFQTGTFGNKKWGYLDKTGAIVIPAQFDYAEPFSEGLARVGMNGAPQPVPGKPGMMTTPITWGYIDKTGKVVMPITQNFCGDYHDGLAWFVVKNPNAAQDKPKELRGFFDKTGKVVVEPILEMTQDFSEGMAGVQYGGKWGFVNAAGHGAINPQFDAVYSFQDGRAAVLVNGKCGYINKAGQLVIPAQYDYAYSFSDGLASVGRDNRFGYIDRTGKEVIPVQFEYAGAFSCGLACFTENHIFGYIDKTGQKVIPPTFMFAYPFQPIAGTNHRNRELFPLTGKEIDFDFTVHIGK